MLFSHSLSCDLVSTQRNTHHFPRVNLLTKAQLDGDETTSATARGVGSGRGGGRGERERKGEGEGDEGGVGMGMRMRIEKGEESWVRLEVKLDCKNATLNCSDTNSKRGE